MENKQLPADDERPESTPNELVAENERLNDQNQRQHEKNRKMAEEYRALQQENEGLKVDFKKAIENFKTTSLQVIREKEQAQKERDELKTIVQHVYDCFSEDWPEKLVERVTEALKEGESNTPDVKVEEANKAKAWDDWRDSLVKHDNILVHFIERPEKYTEPFTFEEFKAVMLEKSPVFFYNVMYSTDKPLYQVTSQFMPSGVDYFATSWADKTPKRKTLEQFYKMLKMDGLESIRF